MKTAKTVKYARPKHPKETIRYLLISKEKEFDRISFPPRTEVSYNPKDNDPA